MLSSVDPQSAPRTVRVRAAQTPFKKELIAQWQGVWRADNLSQLMPSGLLLSWKGHTLLEMVPAND